MKPAIMTLALLLHLSAVAQQEKSYLFTGNSYLQSSTSHQLGYVAGAIDGVELYRASDYPLDKCIGKKPLRQLHAMVNKYIDSNPGQWDQPMSKLVMLAILKGCLESN